MIQIFNKQNILKYIYKFNIKWKYVFLLISVIVCSYFIHQIYENKLSQLGKLQILYNKISQLKNNNIVKNHVLNNLEFNVTKLGKSTHYNDSEQFVQYIEKEFNKKYGKINNIKVSNHTKLSSINITQIEISNIFIHDKFIFEYIDKIHSYSGFVRVSALKIEKKQLDNKKNILVARIICDLYSK